MRIFLPLAAALAATALSAQSPLMTTFAGGNGQSGNQFDVGALVPLNVTGFDVNLDAGTWDLEVYQLNFPNTSYAGSVNTAGDWTLIGSVTGLVSNGPGVATPLGIATINVPIAAGEIQAFYVTVTNGTAINYTNGTTTGALFASNAEMEFFEGAGLAYPFTANFNPRVFNGNIYYSTGTGFATKVQYGASCSFPTQFGERFAQGDPVDLANTQWIFADNGDGSWTVNPAGSGFAYDAVTAAANGLEIRDPSTPWGGAFTSSSCACWDDATVVFTPTSGPYQYANATTGASELYTDVSVNTNGTIRLGAQDPSNNTFGYNGGNSGFVTTVFNGSAGPMLAQFAVFYNDLDIDASGSIWIEDGTATSSGGLRVTWDNVPNWDDPAGPAAEFNDLQITIIPGGITVIAFGNNVGNGGSGSNEAIVGFSLGDTGPDNRLDWTTAMNNYLSGSGFAGPTTDATAAPVFGTSINVTVDGLPATSVVGGVIYGFTQLNPGISLGPVIGINCDALASLDVIEIGAQAGGSYLSAPLAIPNDPTLTGVIVAGQGFGLDIGLVGPSANEVNDLGATMGNAVLLTLGM